MAILVAVIMILTTVFATSAEVEESLPVAVSSWELCSFMPHDLGASEAPLSSKLWM
jgi:hypothetical protein